MKKILREIRQTIKTKDEKESIENAFKRLFFLFFFNIYFNASNQHFSKEYRSIHLHTKLVILSEKICKYNTQGILFPVT